MMSLGEINTRVPKSADVEWNQGGRGRVDLINVREDVRQFFAQGQEILAGE